MEIKKVAIIFSFLLLVQNVTATPNIYHIFCDVRLQDITESNYIFQVNSCYGYFFQDYSCKIENLNERYKWQNYTLISDKNLITQNLTLNTEYRIQTSEWSGSANSQINFISDMRDLQILAKEVCSKTLGRDYSGRFNSWLEVIPLLFMFFVPVFIFYILPIIVILALCWIVYKKFKSEKKH